MQSFKTFLSESEAITCFHGTDQQISSFKGVVFFTPREDAATAYGRGKASMHRKAKFYVYEVKLKYTNLLKCKSMQQIGSFTQADIEQYRAQGYDGAYYDGLTGLETIPEYVSFYPEKITIEHENVHTQRR